MAVTRRRSRRDEEETDERDERPTRRRRASDDMPVEERNTRPRRRREADDEPEDDDRPRRGRRSRDEDEDDRPRRGRRSRDEEPEDEDDDRPRRRRGRDNEDEGGSRRRRGTSGFGAYSSKKRASGDFAKEFKPGENKPTLIKLLEEGPFDSYNQHWINELKRKSYVCLDDEEYFGADSECPLCEIGEDARTFGLFNILDLSNPRKPEVKVWAAPPTVTDKFARASEEKKTSPLNREDVYFEVELQVSGKNKKQWSVIPVKARDLEDDYDIEPLDADELETYSEDLPDDRKAVTKVDSYEDLAEIADDLMD